MGATSTALLLNRNTILIFLFLFTSCKVFSQTRVSVSTDFSLQRNLKDQQRFWAIGQNVVMDWHFTPKGGAYAAICYYSNGKFKNDLSATAKSSNTSPQEIFFVNKAQVRLVQISFGWKHYFIGVNDAESNWNLYSITGFGLIFGKAINTYTEVIDTSLYDTPQQPVSGTGHFKRLTLDLGLGFEIPLGGDIYFYSDGKVWIPTTDYPSKYLFVNNNAPLAVMVSAGLRILF